MDEENLDIIDAENKVIGQAPKPEAHEKGLRHRVSAILVQRIEDGKYLITTAASQKPEAGGLYHSAAGHVAAGETYLEGARRELEEETGIHAPPKAFKLLGIWWFEKDYPTRKERERFEIYHLPYVPDMGEVVLNEEHVNPQWLTLNEIKAIYREHPERVSDPLKMTLRSIFKFDE